MVTTNRWTPRADDDTTRVDLHLHSWASGMATNWWVKSLGFGFETRESYTPPDDAYRTAKQAGMDFVTLTDHETIDGALTLVDKSDFFVGEEVSALFPEEGNTVDILIYGLVPADHQEIQARRDNVYALVDYLREADLVHVLAHPMVSLTHPLDRAGIEKRLVLFGLWEFINGARSGEQNGLAQRVASNVDALDLRQMAARHGLVVPPHRAIAGTGGSDDHGSIFTAATYTVVPKVTNTRDLLAALAAGETQPAGEDGSPEKLTHTGFRIAGTAFAERLEREAAETSDGSMLNGDDAFSGALSLGGRSGQIEKLLEYLPLVASLNGSQIRGALVSRYERRVGEALRGASSAFPMISLLGSIGDLVESHVFIAPYVGVHGYFGRETQKVRALRRHLFNPDPEPLRVGVFVEDMDEIHGIATLYKNLNLLANKSDVPQLRFIQCATSGQGGTTCLRPIATLPIPLVAGRSLGVPSLLDVLDHIASARYDLLHVVAPGPLGLAALIAGSTLGIPTVGAYHTEFGQYAEVLSGDSLVGDIVEVAVREFYERCAVVAVPSHSTALALRARGYGIERIEVLKNGVDTALYHPNRRSAHIRDSLGAGKTLLLYAGRVSREKGLEGLAHGYLALRKRRNDIHLVIAGDGPYRAELETLLGEQATFTGFLRGEALADTYAACDIFVFPSTTDTLGRAVAEAQASGVPAVVYASGGPQECIRPGRSGFVVETGDELGFWSSVETLLDDLTLRTSMANEARQFALTLSWESVLDGLIDLYQELLGRSSPPDEAFEDLSRDLELAVV